MVALTSAWSFVKADLASVFPVRIDWVKVFIAGVASTVVTLRKLAVPPGAAQVLATGTHSSTILTLFLSAWNSLVLAIDLSGGSPIPVFCVHSGAMFW